MKKETQKRLVRVAKVLEKIAGDTIDFDQRLPKDLSKMSKKQIKSVIVYLSKKPVKELRKKQDLVNKQIEKAFNEKNDFAMSNLGIMRDILTEAVMKKEFGDD